MDRVLSVLLVDDEPTVRSSLRLVLEAMGFKVNACTNPLEALEVLKGEAAFDVVISDLKMPHMSGIDLLSTIRGANSKIPFILMSGHATKEEVSKARALGINSFLPKPFSPHELLFLLDELEVRNGKGGLASAA